MAGKVIIIAGHGDWSAQAFIERYAASGACLMTPEDLSVVGWRHRLGASHAGTAVVAGRRLAPCDITGVVTRLAGVVEEDVEHIVPADRTYVAAEMTAFLRSWLTELQCPILNQPTPNCLSGPYWSHEKWVHTAVRLGIPITPVRRRVTLSAASSTVGNPQPDGIPVTVVGHRYCGAVHPVLAKQARALANTAGVDLLAVRFSGSEPGARFVGADLWPDIAAGDVANAILEYFEGRAKQVHMSLEQ